jgi:hypothetical protein
MKPIRILGVVVLVVLLVLCGCTQNHANDNAEFLDWMQADLDYHSATTDKLVNEMNSYEWYNLEVAADEAETHITTISEPQCDSFTVSGQYAAVRDEYHEYLSDTSLFYSYVKSAGRDMLYGQLGEATDAFSNGTDRTRQAKAHLETLTELVKSL